MTGGLTRQDTTAIEEHKGRLPMDDQSSIHEQVP